MGTPIINPLVFYFADIVDTLKNFCSNVFVIVMLLLLILAALTFVDTDSDSEKIRKQMIMLQKPMIICLIIGLLSLLLPSEKMIYKMVAASFVTQENVKMTGDKFDEYFNQLVKAIERRNQNDH